MKDGGYVDPSEIEDILGVSQSSLITSPLQNTNILLKGKSSRFVIHEDNRLIQIGRYILKCLINNRTVLDFIF